MDFSFLILSQDSMLIFGHRMLSSSTTLLRTVFYIQSYLLTVLFFFFVPQGEDGDAAVPSVTTRGRRFVHCQPTVPENARRGCCWLDFWMHKHFFFFLVGIFFFFSFWTCVDLCSPQTRNLNAWLAEKYSRTCGCWEVFHLVISLTSFRDGKKRDFFLFGFFSCAESRLQCWRLRLPWTPNR